MRVSRNNSDSTNQGHKRWEKAVIPGLENLRSLIHQNMLPAIGRCTLILSRLSGIARFHEEEDHIGFTNAEITRLVDILSAFKLVCHKVLLIVMEELELFQMFSSWLRITIDRVSSSTVPEEITEKEALLDPSKILWYIEEYLVSSPMAIYFAKVPQETWNEDWERMQECSTILDKLDEQLKLEQAGEPFMISLPQMAFLVDFLTAKAGDVFHNIAEAEKRSVRFGQAVKLEMAPGGSAPETFALVDVKMCSVPKPNGVDGITYTAVVSEENPYDVGIFETKIQIIDGVSSAPSTAFYYISRLDPHTDSRVVDIKFLNEEVLLALCHSEGGQPHLLRILFRPKDPHYQSTQSGITSLSHDAPSSSLVRRMEFTEDLASFVPVRMEVMEADNSKGGVPARVCLLGSGGVNYKVFALPEPGEQMEAAA